MCPMFQCSYFVDMGGESHKCTLCLYEVLKWVVRPETFQHFFCYHRFWGIKDTLGKHSQLGPCHSSGSSSLASNHSGPGLITFDLWWCGGSSPSTLVSLAIPPVAPHPLNLPSTNATHDIVSITDSVARVHRRELYWPSDRRLLAKLVPWIEGVAWSAQRIPHGR
jgi:hypothetical protein